MPRVKPHFKLHVSIQNHQKTLGVYADDALLAMYTRIGVMAIERFADRTGDSFPCSAKDLCRLATTWPISNALRKLERLTTATPVRIDCLCGAPAVPGDCGSCGTPAAFRLSMPNFAKKQGFKERNGAETGDSPTPDSAVSPSTSQEHALRACRAEPQVGQDSPAETFLDEHPKLLNLLSKQTGDEAEKRAWLNDEGPVLEADYKAGRGTWMQLTTRYYRRYLQGQRKHREAGERERLTAAVRAAEEADRAAAHAS